MRRFHLDFLAALVFLALGCALILPRSVVASCRKPERALPLIVVRFEIGDQRLQAKLSKARLPEVESQLTNKLADLLRCVDDTAFLDWVSAYEPYDKKRRSAGTLHAFLQVQEYGALYEIKLKLAYAIGEGGMETELPVPAAISQVFNTTDGKMPGQKGDAELWKAKIIDRFEKLTDPSFGFTFKTLQKHFLPVPISNSKDILQDRSEQVVGLPVPVRDFEAGEGTEMLLTLGWAQDGAPKTQITLAKVPCKLTTAAWKDRVQCRIGPDSHIGWERIPSMLSEEHRADLAKSTVTLTKYEWGAPSTCDHLALD